MISPENFYGELKKKGIGVFTGVPDSLLKHFCAFVDEHSRKNEHIITANEGNAVALASGYHLATGGIGAVYMQNSGLGNCINPLTSLTDPAVYRIPMLLIIGWRGEPGIKDEPQHIKQGRITKRQLELLGIPYWVIQADSDIMTLIDDIFFAIETSNAPAAFLVRNGTFSTYNRKTIEERIVYFTREDALNAILDLADTEDLFVSTTGKTSRELFELRVKRQESQHDFLTVGSMGHTSSIALGVALGAPNRRVICLDGDGSAIMHLGALSTIGSRKPANLIHVILNNCAHESVGGQATVANQMDFSSISMACGYQRYHLVQDVQSLKQSWKIMNHENKGPQLIEIVIKTGSRDNLGRPTTTPLENKLGFMARIHG